MEAASKVCSHGSVAASRQAAGTPPRLASVAVTRLTRFLVKNDMPFVLHDAFMVDDDDQIVFEKGGFALAGEAG